jgi:hypothetical protein
VSVGLEEFSTFHTIFLIGELSGCNRDMVYMVLSFIPSPVVARSTQLSHHDFMTFHLIIIISVESFANFPVLCCCL